MIIDVEIEGEEQPRRYRVRRDNGTICLRRLAAAGEGAAAEEPIHIDWTVPEPRVYSLLIGETSYDIHIDQDENDEEKLVVHLLSHVLRIRASDARKRRVASVDRGPEGIVQITAPIPGRVVKVLAPAGTEVRRGDGIIVLEAMKMENELKAPRDGTVTAICVQEGQGVEGGASLATIE